MKRNLRMAMLLFIFTATQAFSQNNCTLTGWASQNGGVTGGGSATPTVVSNYAAFKAAIENAAVKVVHISGTITFPSAGRINFQDQTGKTIYGLPGSKLVSSDLSASGSGILYVKRLSNIIFRNIKFEGPGAYDTDGNDNMTIDNCTNIWVDHCDFQDGVDGNLDIKNLADYISVTWCRFIYLKPPISGGSGGAADHRFSNLFGSSDGATGDRGKLRITMQNCWWAQGCKERMPRVRFGKVHLVNNYFSSAGNNHCVRAGFEADLRIESNYFENVNNPIDLFENNFTAVSSVNNLFVNTTGTTAGSGTAFTPPYSLSITPASNVKSQVTAGAGATLTSPNCSGSITTYTLATTSTPAAGGSVSGAGSYTSGSVATVTATPASGYTFTGWSGDASGTANPLSVTMSANKTVTANFTPTAVNFYTLTTNAAPAAGGSVTRSPNSTSYAAGTVVSLTATPATGYTFTGWSGGASGSSNPINVTINANTTVTANFTASAATYTLITTASPAAGGSIARNPNAASYAAGTVVSLTATPATGYTFTGWSGDGSGTANPLSITMNANKSVTAIFSAATGNTTLHIEDKSTSTLGYCGADGSRQNSYSGASGGYYINISNGTGKGINWSVRAGTAGSYKLKWRYANAGSQSATSARVLVNGSQALASVAFPKTSSWTAWTTTADVTVTLGAGINKIRVETTSSNEFAIIDWIEITGTSPSEADCSGTTGSIAANTATYKNMSDAQEFNQVLFPNPLTDSKTTLRFYSDKPQKLKIDIFAADGKLIANAANGQFARGTHYLQIEKSSLKAGFYLVVILNENGEKTTTSLIVE